MQSFYYKNERKQEKVSKLQKENDALLRQEFYKEAENENSSLTIPKQLEEMYHDPKHLNLISSKDWPSPVGDMYREHYKALFDKGIFDDIIMTDVVSGAEAAMEIKFIVNPPASEIKPLKYAYPKE